MEQVAMVSSLLDSLIQIAVILAVIWLLLSLASMKWKGARSMRGFYGSVITTTLAAIAGFLWQPRMERQGGAQLSLPQFEMEDEEWNSDDFE